MYRKLIWKNFDGKINAWTWTLVSWTAIEAVDNNKRLPENKILISCRVTEFNANTMNKNEIKKNKKYKSAYLDGAMNKRVLIEHKWQTLNLSTHKYMLDSVLTETIGLYLQW